MLYGNKCIGSEWNDDTWKKDLAISVCFQKVKVVSSCKFSQKSLQKSALVFAKWWPKSEILFWLFLPNRAISSNIFSYVFIIRNILLINIIFWEDEEVLVYYYLYRARLQMGLTFDKVLDLLHFLIMFIIDWEQMIKLLVTLIHNLVIL